MSTLICAKSRLASAVKWSLMKGVPSTQAASEGRNRQRVADPWMEKNLSPLPLQDGAADGTRMNTGCTKTTSRHS